MQLHDFLCGTLMEEHKALALDICIYLLHMNAIVPQAPAAKDSKAKDPKRKLILTSKKDFHPDNLFRFLRHHHFLESRDPNAPLFGCLLFSPEEVCAALHACFGYTHVALSYFRVYSLSHPSILAVESAGHREQDVLRHLRA
jgi:hypothetical protein